MMILFHVVSSINYVYNYIKVFIYWFVR